MIDLASKASQIVPGEARLLVSACLLGDPVRYDGRARQLAHEGLRQLLARISHHRS